MLNTFRPRRTVLLAAGALALGAVLPLQASANTENWPDKPIHLIVPYAPGGATDVTARIISQRLSEGLGQSVVVENRGGANGTIGTSAVARAKPDGYTLLLNTAGAQTLSPVIYDTDYQALDSFEPVSLIARLGFVMVAHPSVPANNLQEFIEYAKKNQDTVSVSSGSAIIGLMNEHFKNIIGAPGIANVQYKGTGPQLTAVIGGEVQMTIDPYNGVEMIKAGRVKPLAIIAENRSAVFPDVPTMKELGIDNMDFSSWAALLAPKGTPKPIIDKLHAEIVRIVALPEVQQQLKQIEYEPVGSTPEELGRVIKQDTERWVEILKTSSFKPG